MSAPHVSVVVPARDSEAGVARALASLAAQDFAEPWEVVVVDDGSHDGTARVASEHGATVVRLDHPGGPAAARAAGVAASRAPLLAFTDADCEASPGWLTALVTALERADIVTGPVRPDPDAQVGLFDRTIRVEGPSPRFESANLAMSREVYERAGGFVAFDERFGGPPLHAGHFGEDAALGWRAMRAGARRGWAPHAVVTHAVQARGPRAYIAERARVRYFPALVRHVPEMRRSLPAGIFLSARSARFDAALAGVVIALAHRRPPAVLLGLPYARRCLVTRGAWRRSVVRQNLALVAGDAVALGALVRGSIAARTALL